MFTYVGFQVGSCFIHAVVCVWSAGGFYLPPKREGLNFFGSRIGCTINTLIEKQQKIKKKKMDVRCYLFLVFILIKLCLVKLLSQRVAVRFIGIGLPSLKCKLTIWHKEREERNIYMK